MWKTGAFWGALSKFARHSTRFPPTPVTSAHVRRGERDEGGELARLTHSPARVLTRANDTRKLESQMLPPPPQPPPVGRAAGGLRLRARRPTPRACFPSEQGLEHSFHPMGTLCRLAHRGGEIETENPRDCSPAGQQNQSSNNMRTSALLLIAATAEHALAQDPASGWMAYAVGAIPSSYERITRLDMTWTVGAAPKPSAAFFSPWFGMDPADNLNLIQPVNPWGRTAWSMYTEYYQWSPTHNSNSKQYAVEAGQTLLGSLVYDAQTDSYTLSQKILETGDVSSQVVTCQNDKKYNIPYIVYEKTFPCADYPPDEVRTLVNCFCVYLHQKRNKPTVVCVCVCVCVSCRW